MGKTGSTETSVSNYQSTLRNIPEGDVFGRQRQNTLQTIIYFFSDFYCLKSTVLTHQNVPFFYCDVFFGFVSINEERFSLNVFVGVTVKLLGHTKRCTRHERDKYADDNINFQSHYLSEHGRV